MYCYSRLRLDSLCYVPGNTVRDFFLLNPKINLVGDKNISIFDSSNNQKQNNMNTVKVFAETIHFDPATYKETVMSRRFIGEYANDVEAFPARKHLLPGETFCTQGVPQSDRDEYDAADHQLECDLEEMGF